MKKKIFIYALLCVVLCSITGCANDITPPLSTGDATGNTSIQVSGGSSEPTTTGLTTDTSTLLSTSTQSAESSHETTTTELTTDASTILSTSTQSAESSHEPTTTELTTDTSTTSSEPTGSDETTNSRGDTMDDTYKLIVRGKELTDIDHVKLNYEHRYAELPLTRIMEELGAKVEWTDKTTANITFDKIEYVLDTTKGSLVKKGSDFNVLVLAPGSNHGTFYRVVDNEFIIDNDSAKWILINIMGTKMSIDFDNRIVDIDFRN